MLGVGAAGLVVGHIFMPFAQIKRHHRHPGIHFHTGAGDQLPSGAAEQIGLHFDVAVGEIHRFGHAVAIIIGISLQIHGGGAIVGDAFYQFVEIALHLTGIGVVNIIQIHMHHALHAVVKQARFEIILDKAQIAFLIDQLTADIAGLGGVGFAVVEG